MYSNDNSANRDKDKVFRVVGPTGYERSYDKELGRKILSYTDFVLVV
jgi:hypothetical protein